MIPGPDYFYQCPECNGILKKGSLMSANTFHAEIWSDGKYVAPNRPDFPLISKCNSCGAIFWLEEPNRIKPNEQQFSEAELEQQSETARFLSIDDYPQALEFCIVDEAQDELFLRKELWWAFNDRIRCGEEIFQKDSDAGLWRTNANALLTLLKDESDDERILLAELYRNLDNFEKCIEFINRITDPELEWTKPLFREQCKKRNKQVFMLHN